MEVSRFLIYALCSLLIAIFVKWMINFTWKCRKYPPGPWGLPILGYSHRIGNKPHETFIKLAKKYGSVFSVSLGLETFVVLNDWDSVKQALVEQPKNFNGRPYMFLFQAMSKQNDIGCNDGPVWKTQRNLAIQILRNMGVRKSLMETKVMDLVHDLLDVFARADGQVLPMESVIFGPIVKVNWRFISGDDVGNKAADLKEFERIFAVLFTFFQSDVAVNSFPWLRFLPPDGFGYWKVIRANRDLMNYLKTLIDQHVVNFNEANLNDFIDYYLAEIKNHEKHEEPFTNEFLLMTIWGLFLAGVETTNTTSLWGFLYLAHNPEVQKKAQAEIDEVVGRHRLPNMKDMSSLPYLEALVMEIHRKASVVHLSLPHRATANTTIKRLNIPKDATIIQNIYAIHHDPKLWDQPEAFRPERFIDETGKAKAPPYFMPFSIGPRICLGQSLAEMELRLVFSCLLQQFTLNIPKGGPTPTLEPDVRFTLTPHPYALHIHKRKD